MRDRCVVVLMVGFGFLGTCRLLEGAIVGLDANTVELIVGETTTVRVELSELSDGEQLDYLAASVTTDSSIVTPSSTPIAGEIISDTSGFTGAIFVGQADGIYDEVTADSGAPISGNGVFFSFDVAAVTPGTGTLSVDFADGDPASVDAGPPLQFTVTRPDVIPEPTTAVIWTLLFLWPLTRDARLGRWMPDNAN